MKAVIEIAADSRGVVAGLQPANKALDETAKKADRAEKEVKDLGHSGQMAGRNMSAAFAATGGGLAITHGLEGIAGGLRSGSGAMATFAASQALLDLGRFAEDMKGVTAATGGATSIFGTLGAVMKAHPLMTIATVLAGAAAAMSIFSDDTSEAADEFDRLAESMEKARMSKAARELLGLGIGPALQQQQTQLISVAEQLARQQQDPTLARFTYAQLAERVPGGLSAEQLRQMGREALGPEHVEARLLTMSVAEREVALRNIDKVSIPVAQAILRRIYRDLQQAIETEKPTGTAGPALRGGAMGPPLPPGYERYADPSLLPLMRDRAAAPTPLGPPLPPGGLQPYADPTLFPTLGNMQGVYTGGGPGQTGVAGTGLGLMGPGMNVMGTVMVQNAEYMREQNELAKQRMQELIGLGEQFGQTIGDAFFRVAEGTMTARQAMAELVRMFAQMAAQGIFREIGGAVGASFGPTQAQTTANTTPAPTSMGP